MGPLHVQINLEKQSWKIVVVRNNVAGIEMEMKVILIEAKKRFRVVYKGQ